MTSNDVLSMYENIAGMTNKMVVAARSSDWDGLQTLENQCTGEAGAAMAGAVPTLSGTARMRKIDLLKQILANDREIRTITEPWMTQLAKVMPAPRAGM